MAETLYCQITSGRGPVEVTRVVWLVQLELAHSAFYKNIRTQLIEYEEGTHDRCMFSCIMKLSSDSKEQLELFRKEWEGSVLWVATDNEFRPNHRRKNWYVGVSCFEIIPETTINEKDIQYQTTRSSGPGGQNVNKVESAVRATHIPTGISVLAQEFRDQTQNKKMARERLIAKLSAVEEAKKKQQTYEIWMNHNLLQRGNPVKKFIGSLSKKPESSFLIYK